MNYNKKKTREERGTVTMENRKLTWEMLENYMIWLYENERSRGTIEKYRYYMLQFMEETAGREVEKDLVIAWKQKLRERLAPSTVNGALAAVNGLFRFLGWDSCVVRLIKIRRRIFGTEETELTKEEYQRLVQAAKERRDERMELLLQTVCSTGIRISELPFITAEAVERGCAEVDCKGKVRRIFLTSGLRRILKAYMKKQGIESGPVFVTRTGRAMDRSNIWREMKKLAELAGVAAEKVFPHNLRHLFARVYYSMEKDLLRLADILGHSSINTTRIYTMESGGTHIRQLEKMGLLAEENKDENNRITLLL